MSDKLQGMRDSVEKLEALLAEARKRLHDEEQKVGEQWRVVVGGGTVNDTKLLQEKANLLTLETAARKAREDLNLEEEAARIKAEREAWQRNRDYFEAVLKRRNEAGQRLQEGLERVAQAARDLVAEGGNLMRAAGFRHRESMTKEAIGASNLHLLVEERLALDVPSMSPPVGLPYARAMDPAGEIKRQSDALLEEWDTWNPDPRWSDGKEPALFTHGVKRQLEKEAGNG